MLINTNIISYLNIDKICSYLFSYDILLLKYCTTPANEHQSGSDILQRMQHQAFGWFPKYYLYNDEKEKSFLYELVTSPAANMKTSSFSSARSRWSFGGPNRKWVINTRPWRSTFIRSWDWKQEISQSPVNTIYSYFKISTIFSPLILSRKKTLIQCHSYCFNVVSAPFACWAIEYENSYDLASNFLWKVVQKYDDTSWNITQDLLVCIK